MLPKGFLVGNVSSDPQSGVSSTSSNPYVRFSVACNNNFARVNEPNKGHFFDLVAWGKNVKFIQEYVKKGDKVLVEFQLSTSSYVNQEGKNIKKVDFMVQTIEKVGGSSARRVSQGDEEEAPPYDEPDEKPVSLSDLGL